MNLVENLDLDIWQNAEKWEKEEVVHPSWLLKPGSFHMIESPVIKDKQVDDHALLMLTKANHILDTFHHHLKSQMKQFRENYISHRDLWPTKELIRLSDSDLEFLEEMRSCRNHFRQNVALIHEWICRHHPESAGFINNDKTRAEPYMWLDLVLETNQDPSAIGLDYEEAINDWYVMEPWMVMDPSVIDLPEEFVEEAVQACQDLWFQVNFAITQGCRVVNYINYRNIEIEIEELKFSDENRKKILAQYESEQSPDSKYLFFNRYNEALYRQKKYSGIMTLPTKYPDVHPEIEYERNSLLPLKFLKNICPKVSVEAQGALSIMMKHDQSVGLTEAKHKLWRSRAENLPKYIKARRILFAWYQNRIDIVSEEAANRAISFLLDKYSDFAFEEEEKNVFIADQTVVSEMIKNGQTLPKADRKFKDSMSAIRELSPQLKELGLKIVPIEAITIEPAPGEDGVPITDERIHKAINQLENIGTYDDFIRGLQTSTVVHDVPNKIKMVDVIHPSKEVIEAVTNSTSEYAQKLESQVKLDQWKDTDMFRGFKEKLGGGPECNIIDIARCQGKQVYTLEQETAMQAEKDNGDKPTKIKGYITINSAKNIGNKIVKENDLQPVKGYNVMTKEKAILKAFTEACRKAFNATKINSPEIAEAVKKLQGAKKFSTDIDGAFKLHMKKLKLSAEDIKFFSEKAKNYEGSREPTRAAKYSADAVAIIFCENHNNGQ